VFEGVEDVGLAELDRNRTPSPSRPRVVPVEIAIDAAIHDLERHPTAGPVTDLLEDGTRNPNQVTVVLSTEVRLDLPAISIDIHKSKSEVRNQKSEAISEFLLLTSHFLFLSQMIRRPSSVRSGSTCWIARVSGPTRVANPPVAMQTT